MKTEYRIHYLDQTLAPEFLQAIKSFAYLLYDFVHSKTDSEEDSEYTMDFANDVGSMVCAKCRTIGDVIQCLQDIVRHGIIGKCMKRIAMKPIELKTDADFHMFCDWNHQTAIWTIGEYTDTYGCYNDFSQLYRTNIAEFVNRSFQKACEVFLLSLTTREDENV